MSPEAWAELAALGLAVLAAWWSRPRAPALDWERLFKFALATAIRGEVEAAGGDRAEWRRRLLDAVPWHPAMRMPEERLAAPDPAAIPAPAREGERALVEALARLDDPASRWRRAYGEGGEGLEALLEDPALLGPDHDPERVLGPGADWDAAAAWAEPVRAGVARRLADTVLVTLGGAGVPAEALAEALGRPVEDASAAAARVGVPEGERSAEGDALGEALLAHAPRPADRLVLLAGGNAAFAALVALRAHPLLRDRVRAVVSLGGRIRGGARDAWLERFFAHEGMDPEVSRAIAYFSVVDVDPTAPLARPWAEQRFPEPPLPPSGRRSIAAIDLGPLPLDRCPPRALARALLLVLSFHAAGGGP